MMDFFQEIVMSGDDPHCWPIYTEVSECLGMDLPYRVDVRLVRMPRLEWRVG